MKLLSLLISVILFANTITAQYTTRSFSFDSVNRQYILYVPPMYDGSVAVPFVMALHGLGDNMNNFKGINFKSIADTANFIFAIPQALVDGLSGSTAWNSGAGAVGITLNPTVDDVGFLNALMDTVAAEYNIDQQRLYATGFSMGGFMSNRLACELNNRIAAIASVSGTIGGGLNCQPGRAIPVAHFHGTADGTVSFSGNLFGSDAEDLIKFWALNNHCDTVAATIDTLPDTKADGKVVIHYTYPNGAYNTEVEFFKVIGGQHEWLTAANDINYSAEIWKFFSRQKWEAQTGIAGKHFAEFDVNIFPNPASNMLNISLEGNYKGNVTVQLLDITGSVVYKNTFNAADEMNSFSIAAFSKGVYFLHVENNQFRNYKKVILAE
jgi:polyhydroxybutyrate depolymerase